MLYSGSLKYVLLLFGEVNAPSSRRQRSRKVGRSGSARRSWCGEQLNQPCRQPGGLLCGILASMASFRLRQPSDSSDWLGLASAIIHPHHHVRKDPRVRLPGPPWPCSSPPSRFRSSSMSSEASEAAVAQIKDVITRLQSPVSDISTLLCLLAAPLNCIGLLPPRFTKYDTESLSKDHFSIAKHLPSIQRALLEHVIPAWEPTLLEEGYHELVEQYFCPDAISFASRAAGQVAVLAYSTILSSTIHEPAVRLLVKLCRAYPIDVLFSAIASSKGKLKEVTWEDCVRNVAALPVKVANAMGPRGSIPAELQLDTYFNNLSLRCERLMFTLSNGPLTGGYTGRTSSILPLKCSHRRSIIHYISTDQTCQHRCVHHCKPSPVTIVILRGDAPHHPRSLLRR